MKKGGGLQGQILVAMDVITEDEITAALREQAESKLYEIFEWRRGSFKLEIGSRLQRGNTLALETSPANIILEGVRHWSPRQRVDAFMARHGHQGVGWAKSPFYRFQDVDLSAVERSLVDGLDGAQTLRDLTGDDDGLQRTFFGLVSAELLELEGEPVKAPAASVSHAPTGPRPAKSARKVAVALKEDRVLRSELAAMADRLRGKTYFEVLDVEEDASAQQIDAAYEQLARKAHPDHYNKSSEAVRQLADDVFQLLSRARDTIVDPGRRREYLADFERGMRDAAKQERDRYVPLASAEFLWQLPHSRKVVIWDDGLLDVNGDGLTDIVHLGSRWGFAQSP